MAGPTRTASEISVAAIWKKGALGALLRLAAPLLDRALGIRRFRELYERDGLSGLDRFAFIERFLLREGIEYELDEPALSRIPPTGPALVVANHPLGGLEGILLLWILRLVRPDYKAFANVMDSFLVELTEFFIFTNPMAKGSEANYESIRLSREWLAQGHCLLVFPAGRVGLYRPEKGYVTDEAWDEIALRLGIMTKAEVVPIFVEGECSPIFSAQSRYVYPMKLLGLIPEFLRSLRKRVVFRVGRSIPAARLEAMDRRKANAWLRMRTFLLCPPGRAPARRRPARGTRGVPSSARGILHPEVEDFIARYGLREDEIDELAESVPAGGGDIRGILRALAEAQAKGRTRTARPCTPR